MPDFILLTRLMREEVHPAFALGEREERVTSKIDAYIPGVEWVDSFAIMGPWDYVDVFRAPDMPAAMKVSALVRHYGAAHTEVWPATPWKEFRQSIAELAAKIGQSKEGEQQ